MNLFRQDVVLLDRGENTNCTVNLHGATITSWRVENKEQLFVSNLSVYDNKQAIRGGIQVLFPHYGTWEFGLHHGFARITKWTVEKAPYKLPNDDVEAIFSLSDDDFTSSIWCYSFKIVYQVILREKELFTHFNVYNTSKNFKLTCDLLLNVYVKVPALKKTHLKGLKGHTYVDVMRPDNVVCVDKRNCFITKGHTNRMYFDSPEELLMTHIMSGHRLKITKSNCPLVTLWNPGHRKLYTLIDFEEHEHKRTLVMGFGQTAVTLLPLEMFEGSLSLMIEEVEDEANSGPTYIQLVL